MTRADEHQPFLPRPLPTDYIEEHRTNSRWLAALRAAFRRGITDREAGEEANDAVPEALEPSRYPTGDPHEEAPQPAVPKPEPEVRAMERVVSTARRSGIFRFLVGIGP